MTTELKPCPFCGGEAERVDIEDGDNAGGSFVHCTQCDASGNVEFEFKENFISNWNRRSPSALAAIDLHEEMVKALREIAELTDPDDEDSYRADDREGCLDAVHDTARALLSRIEGERT